MTKLSPLEYSILEECQYDNEPLSMVILAAFTDQGYQVVEIISALAKLAQLAYLEFSVGPSYQKIKVSRDDLSLYIARRRAAKEHLSKWPEAVEEYYAKTTENGRLELRQEDRAVVVTDWPAFEKQRLDFLRQKIAAYKAREEDLKKIQEKRLLPSNKSLVEFGFSEDELKELGLLGR